VTFPQAFPIQDLHNIQNDVAFTILRFEIHTSFFRHSIWLTAILLHLKVDKVDNIRADGCPEHCWKCDIGGGCHTLLIVDGNQRSCRLKEKIVLSLQKMEVAKVSNEWPISITYFYKLAFLYLQH